MHVKKFIVPAILIGISVFIYFDTKAYREQLAAIPKKMTPTILEASKASIEADVHRFTECQKRYLEESETGQPKVTPEARSCLISAMNKTTTMMGAFAYATFASHYLTQHPDDEEFRQAALYSINQGRDALVKDRIWQHNPIQQVAIAHDQSVFLRLIHGRKNTTDMFYAMTDNLNKAEFSVLLPAVVRQQEDWQIEHAAGAL